MITFGERKQVVHVIDIPKITRSSLPEKILLVEE